MDPILYRPLDVLDERLRRADPYQRHQPRPRAPDAPCTTVARRWTGRLASWTGRRG